MNEYADIIELHHPEPKKHKRMPMENRAAQFAPFAALSGHEEALAETTRPTSRYIELSDNELYDLSRNLQKALMSHRPVELIHFVPDPHKSGGAYINLRGIVMAIDEYDRILKVSTGDVISLDRLHSLRFL